MKVTYVRETPAFDAILRDPSFSELCELCSRERLVRILVSTVLLNSQGRPATYTFASYSKIWAATQRGTEASFDDVLAAGELADRLWDSYGLKDNGGNFRGALIEGLVRHQLRDRYAGGDLEDNVFVTITNGASYKSRRSVDVVGWDGALGECHDCKTNPWHLDKVLLDDLDDGLPPCFEIGIVTAQNELSMRQALKKLRIRPSPRVHLIYLEEMWDLAPLQAA